MKDLLTEAKEEFDRILTAATEEELSQLYSKITELDGTVTRRCVYGVMTGDCNSDRAQELMDVSAKKWYKAVTDIDGKSIYGLTYLENPWRKINSESMYDRSSIALSALERQLARETQSDSYYNRIATGELVDYMKAKLHASYESV